MFWEERRRLRKLFLKWTIAISVLCAILLFLLCYKGYGTVFESGWLAFLIIVALATSPVLSKLQPVSFWIYLIIMIFVGGLLGASAGTMQRKFNRWMITAHCSKLVESLDALRKTGEIPEKLDMLTEVEQLKKLGISYQEGEYREGKPFLSSLDSTDVTIFTKPRSYYLIVPVTRTDIPRISKYHAYVRKTGYPDWQYEKLDKKKAGKPAS